MLLTYAGLFALFLTWRLVSTPFELDRERQRFLDQLTSRLAEIRFKLAALQASPPALDIAILEIHVQAASTMLGSHVLGSPIDCDIFLRVTLTLREAQPVEVVEYELSSTLHGNSIPAHYVDDMEHWGLVTAKKPVGIGTTFHYTVSKLTKLARRVERAGVPIEGWLHFHVRGVHRNETAATVYRLSILTPTGAISADIKGEKTLPSAEGQEFQNIPYAAYAKGGIYC